MGDRGRLQGSDEILIHAPIEHVWRLISNSTRLEDWGPPVRGIEDVAEPEGIGSWRTVVAEFTPAGRGLTADESRRAKRKKVAHFRERRVDHVEGRKVGYQIEEEDIGMFDVITNVGFDTELFQIAPNETKVVWRFFHDPNGLLGVVMNRLLVLRMQRKNRLAALVSLKKYAEEAFRHDHDH